MDAPERVERPSSFGPGDAGRDGEALAAARDFLRALRKDGAGSAAIGVDPLLGAGAGPIARFVALAAREIHDVRSGRLPAAGDSQEIDRLWSVHDLGGDPLLLELRVTVAMSRLRPEDAVALARPWLTRAAGDRPSASLLTVLGLCEAWSGDLEAGERMLSEAGAMCRTTGDDRQLGETAALLAKVSALRGDVASADRLLTEAREASTRSASPWVAGGLAECAVVVHLVAGRTDAWRGVLGLLTRAGDGQHSGLGPEYHLELATDALLHGNRTRCHELLGALAAVPAAVPAAGYFAAWAAWLRDPDDDARLLALEDAVSALERPSEWVQRTRGWWLLGTVRVRRGELAAGIRALEEASRELTGLGAAGLLRLVRADLPGTGPAPGRPAVRAGERPLTGGERQVADWVGEGLRNRDIAERLGVSVKTVEFHLGNIYRKLGVPHRTALAVRIAQEAASD